MDVAEFIDARLDAMLAHPLNWGGAEAFELQVLLLLELRQFLRQPLPPSKSLRTHLDGYSSFIRERRPDMGPQPLSAVTDDIEAIARELDDFRAALAVSTESAPPVATPSAPDSLGLDVEVTSEAPTKPRAA